jgi:AraC-like DNA-binding protein
MESLSRHRIFSTTDVDEASAFAGRVWERNRTAVIRGQYGLRWNRLEFDKVEFAYIEHDCTVDLRSQGPLSDHFRYFIHDSGTMEHRGSRGTHVSHRDNVLVHSPGMDLESILNPAKFLLVSLDGRFVRSALVQRFRRLPPYSDWLNVLPHSASLHSLRSFTSWLVSELDTPGSPLAESAKARLHAERLLLSLFVECLAEAAPVASEAVVDAGLAQVRKAEEWIDAHLGEPISVEEVAAAVGVGVRSLQMTFKRVRGYSPLAFVTHRRLEAARLMLLHADQKATVTAIATMFGFFELGRFAQRYRQRFGENPSVTLARGTER